jgi:uncharacterized membrane protein
MVESVAEMRLPAKADARVTQLMDKNNEGQLTPAEREELAAWVEVSQSWSLLRAQALVALGRKPQ